MAGQLEILGQGEYAAANFSTAVAETLFERDAAPYASGIINVSVVARRVSDGSPKGFRIIAVMHRAAEGNTVVNVLSNQSTPPAGPMQNVTATVDASNGNFRVRVTGLAATEIAWGMWYDGGRLIVPPA